MESAINVGEGRLNAMGSSVVPSVMVLGTYHTVFARTPGLIRSRLSCSYGSQFKQSRGPSYVNHLEKKIARLEYELRRASEPAQHFQKVPRDRTPPVNHCALPEGSISSLSPEPQHTFNDWTQNKFQCSSPSPQSEWTFTRTNEPFSKSTSSSLVFGGLGYAEDVAPLTDPSIWVSLPSTS